MHVSKAKPLRRSRNGRRIFFGAPRPAADFAMAVKRSGVVTAPGPPYWRCGNLGTAAFSFQRFGQTRHEIVDLIPCFQMRAGRKLC
jgi:hypothetical protein